MLHMCIAANLVSLVFELTGNLIQFDNLFPRTEGVFISLNHCCKASCLCHHANLDSHETRDVVAQ